MNILNSLTEDYHMHSSTFSDGYNSIDELVQYAGKIGMTKITITDHSDAGNKQPPRAWRVAVSRWKNVHNDVQVSFGVEADLLDVEGNICAVIDGRESDFVLLSYHEGVFQGGPEQVKDAFIKALHQHHDRINCIGHIAHGISTADALAIIQVANEYDIPVEVNAKYYRAKPENWNVVLENAKNIYINSDAHMLHELRDYRRPIYEKLGLIK